MQSGLINSPARSMPAKAMMPMINGRPDYQLADALTKVPPLGDGDRFRGDVPQFDVCTDDQRHQGRRPVRQPSTGVWRSMLTEQYSKSFAKAGGVGISNEVYRTLILQQAGRTS